MHFGIMLVCWYRVSSKVILSEIDLLAILTTNVDRTIFHHNL